MNKHGIHILYSSKAWVIGIGLAVGLMLTVGGSAEALDQSSPANFSDTPVTSPKFFKICNGKTADGNLVPHALCATAQLFCDQWARLLQM
jgi:hypothetical protein